MCIRDRTIYYVETPVVESLSTTITGWTGFFTSTYSTAVSTFTGSDGIPTTETVSYTHLDVYKRQTLNSEDSTARAAVGIIGDVAAMFPDGRIKQFYSQDWVTEFIKKTRSNPSFSQTTKDTARWAREQQKYQLNLR